MSVPTSELKKRRLEDAQRIAGIGSWEWEIVPDRTFWSDELFRIYGFEPQSFAPDFQRYIEAIHPEDREKVRAIVSQALDDLQPFAYEFRVVRPDGVVRYCHARGKVFTDDEGAPVRMAGTSQDITERKAMEEELVEARDEAVRALRHAAALESTEVGILVVDLEGRIETANRRFTEMWGIPEEMVRSGESDARDLLSCMSDQMEAPQPLVEKMEAAFASDEATFDTVELNDGRIFEIFSKPQRIDGGIVGRVWSYRDVSKEKEAEAALTAAKRAAEEASLAKGKFLANMSHELRTPLNSVIGFANVLLKNKAGNLLDSDLDYLERIAASGEHLLELINAVLDLSKIEAGKMRAEIEPVSLDELVKQTIGELSGVARGDDVQLRAVLPEDMAVIDTDPVKLKQILINLIANALKFTEKGEVVVSVYADAQTHRPERIEVRDTGPGIPESRLRAIFEAFEQAGEETGRRFGGTGLGLTIASSLSELLGFRLEVESELGVGSTFRVLLRPDESESEPPGERETGGRELLAAELSQEERPGGVPELDGQLVLVIDDDSDSRILLTHHLEESGARTITASTGEQGIQMAREFRPAVITLDLLLPGMTGWEILRALKTDPELGDIPVVIVSVVADENRSSAVGAADVIEKPIDRDELIAALRRTLGPERRRVLIVDDEPDSRDLLSTYLEDEGAEIRAARDGLEALEALEEYTPDIVLIDLLMPNLDGIALIKRLNEREAYRNIPIVVVTAKDLTPEEEETLGQSTLAVVRKGAQLEQGLRAALDRVL